MFKMLEEPKRDSSWKTGWKKDTSTNETMENGTVPTTADEHGKASERPLRWACPQVNTPTVGTNQHDILRWRTVRMQWEPVKKFLASQGKRNPIVPLLLYKGH